MGRGMDGGDERGDVELCGCDEVLFHTPQRHTRAPQALYPDSPPPHPTYTPSPYPTHLAVSYTRAPVDSLQPRPPEAIQTPVPLTCPPAPSLRPVFRRHGLQPPPRPRLRGAPVHPVL